MNEVKRIFSRNKDMDTGKRIPVVAITGGMGTGKSIVAAEFARAGALIIGADTVSKDILWSDKKIQKKIIREFGRDTICDDKGVIVKQKLIRAAFMDEESVRRINSILHPEVRKKIEQLTDEGIKTGQYKFVAVEAALIFESGIQSKFDSIICIIADEKVRLERLMLRDGVSKDELLKRINLQFNQSYIANRSDHVIQNNGTVEEVRSEAGRIAEEILGE